jgi:PAS domain S-box-containing protein
MEQSERLKSSSSDEGRYRLLVEAVTDYAIYMLDPAGIVSSWNPGAERFKGYTRDEILGQHFSRFYTEEDRSRGLPDRALATAASEGKFESEGWRVRKDGTRFWAYVVIDPIRDAAGTLLGFAKITRDLTERRAAEETLRRSQEQFRLLVQGVSDYAIYMLDTEGHVISWNLGAQRIKGYQPEEIIGSHFSRFYTDEDRGTGEPKKALDAARRHGRFEKEGRRVRKDGSRFWASVVIDAIYDDNGKLIGFAKITRDITERKETQQKLEAARDALLQSQKMEAIGQLTGGVAHDFNNLLMAVLASLELMRKRLPDDPKLLALLDNAVQGARRGSALTQRMLAFARRQDLKREPVDLPDLVRGMSELLQQSLGPSVEIQTRFPLVCKPALGDLNQLELILLNLAVNARDAMPDGGQIVIAAREEVVPAGQGARLKPGTYVCLCVTDNGIGMDEETQRRAMEPFFTTKGPGKGTGLGLSMVHGVAEQSGGWFTLRSRKGEGTTAELWLPSAEAGRPAQVHAQVQAQVQTQAGWIPPVPQTNRASLVVLAVDDDSLVLTNTVAMLEDLGHAGIPASSAPAALEILKQRNDIDLVISDYAMPGMNGMELAGLIEDQFPGLPVVIATGYAEMDSAARTALRKLAKPFSQADLAKELERVVPGGRKGGRVLKFRSGGNPAT